MPSVLPLREGARSITQHRPFVFAMSVLTQMYRLFTHYYILFKATRLKPDRISSVAPAVLPSGVRLRVKRSQWRSTQNNRSIITICNWSVSTTDASKSPLTGPYWTQCECVCVNFEFLNLFLNSIERIALFLSVFLRFSLFSRWRGNRRTIIVSKAAEAPPSGRRALGWENWTFRRFGLRRSA